MSSHSTTLPADAGGPRLERLRPCMGTWLAVSALAADARRLHAAVELAYARCAELERRLHPSRSGSDLARVGAAPLHRAVAVHPSTWEVLQIAQQVHALSEGVFDPCLPSRPGVLGDLVLEADARVLCRRSLALDLGGIAKGYVVDCAVEALRAQGCSGGMVNAGGDLRVFGSWREPSLLRLPNGDGYATRSFELTDAALAVSYLDEECRPAEHQGYYLRHSVLGSAARLAAVIAPTAVVADALTKVVLLGSASAADRALQGLQAHGLAPHIARSADPAVSSPETA